MKIAGNCSKPWVMMSHDVLICFDLFWSVWRGIPNSMVFFDVSGPGPFGWPWRYATSWDPVQVMGVMSPVSSDFPWFSSPSDHGHNGRLLDLLRLGRPGIERKKKGSVWFLLSPTFRLSSEKEELRMTQNDSEWLRMTQNDSEWLRMTGFWRETCLEMPTETIRNQRPTCRPSCSWSPEASWPEINK